MSALQRALNKQASKFSRQLHTSLTSQSSQQAKKPIKVMVSGAGGQIGYSLLPRLARGDVWGQDQPIILKMFDLPAAEKVMVGVGMELEDCAFKTLHGLEITTSAEAAYSDADVIIMLANAMVLKADMPRSELLKENLKVYSSTAEIMRNSHNKNVKVLMIANPANTNCLLLIEKLRGILPAENLTALTRLDHNRTKSMVARKLNVHNDHIRRIVVWGNHSMTMVPDLRFAEVKTANGWTKLLPLIKEPNWVNDTLIPTIRDRVSAIIRYRGKSSSLSAASAGIDHLRDWLVGTDPEDYASMGVYTDPIYSDIPKGLVFGQPCTCKNGVFKVVPNLEIDANTKAMLKTTSQELTEERKLVL